MSCIILPERGYEDCIPFGFELGSDETLEDCGCHYRTHYPVAFSADMMVCDCDDTEKCEFGHHTDVARVATQLGKLQRLAMRDRRGDV